MPICIHINVSLFGGQVRFMANPQIGDLSEPNIYQGARKRGSEGGHRKNFAQAAQISWVDNVERGTEGDRLRVAFDSPLNG
jgi:hypothetical protein